MHPTVWLIGALLVAGCDTYLTDPYQRPGTYNPTGVNDANLRVMVANPHDLVEGTGTGASTRATGGAAWAPVLAPVPVPKLRLRWHGYWPASAIRCHS